MSSRGIYQPLKKRPAMPPEEYFKKHGKSPRRNLRQTELSKICYSSYDKGPTSMARRGPKESQNKVTDRLSLPSPKASRAYVSTKATSRNSRLGITSSQVDVDFIDNLTRNLSSMASNRQPQSTKGDLLRVLSPSSREFLPQISSQQSIRRNVVSRTSLEQTMASQRAESARR